MHTTLTLIAQLLPALAGQPAGPLEGAAVALPVGAEVAIDTSRERHRIKAIEYSSSYTTRRTIHRVTSYAMIPLFIGAYVTGNQLIKHPNDAPRWATTLHQPIAIASGVVFAANTVTGVWNLWASRKDPNGQVKRTVHGLLFVAASAGLLYTGTALADDVKDGTDPNRFHRTVALASMGVSAISWGMMIFFR